MSGAGRLLGAPTFRSPSFLIAVALSACASASVAPAPPAAESRPLHDGPLTDFVPAAGLRWMIVGSPRALASEPDLRESLALLFPEPRLRVFRLATGIDLSQTPTALVAQFEYATLYLCETPGPNEEAEDLFLQRLLTEPVRVSPHPRISRVTGLVGTTPETFLRVEDRFIGVSVGDPTPARVAEMFALERLRRTVPALEGSALSTIPKAFEEAVLRGYAPGPFEGEWASAARGLLSGALAVAAAAYPAGDAMRWVVVLSGQWDAGQDLPRLLGAWEDLARSSLGRLLALSEPVDGPAVDIEGDVLKVEVTLRSRPLLAGLHAAVAADVWQLMDFSTPATK